MGSDATALLVGLVRLAASDAPAAELMALAAALCAGEPVADRPGAGEPVADRPGAGEPVADDWAPARKAADAPCAAAVYLPDGTGLSVAARSGDLDAAPARLELPADWPDLPTGWLRIDGNRTDVAVRSGACATAVVSAVGVGPAVAPTLRQVAEVLGVALARRKREDALGQQVRHFVAAQRISHVGSYDFDIAADSNDWSDQLYRIYGREPQSFRPTYATFLQMVHPDDREATVAAHAEALAHLAPYQMEERIVWPDGQVRTLASWGEVLAGPDGKPARMVGICWDVTEQKAAARAVERSSARVQSLIQSAPDVVLVLAGDGTVVQANDRISDLLGVAPAEVLGRPVTELLPAGLVRSETGDGPCELVARSQTGGDIPVEVSTSVVDSDDGPLTAAFVRDLRERKRTEELARRLHDAGVRRRHALEINDNVVQGLASVLYLLDLDRPASAQAAARRTMATARAMMADLLEEAGSGPVEPGELIRGQGHEAFLDEVVPWTPPAAGALRVLLADDSEDLRLLLRLTLTTSGGVEVVAEAANGEEAVQLAAEHQPDVTVLDLSMPVMDGLQAIAGIRSASSGTRIVILSGLDEGRMKPVALELGADAYLEKGDAKQLIRTLAELFPDRLIGTAGRRNPTAG